MEIRLLEEKIHLLQYWFLLKNEILQIKQQLLQAHKKLSFKVLLNTANDWNTAKDDKGP